MRNLTFFVLATCLLFSCKKNSDAPKVVGEDFGCIEQQSLPLNAHPNVTDSGYNLALILLKNVAVYKNNFQINALYTNDSVSQLYNPDANIFRTISVRQYANELPLLTEDIYFVFQKNTLRMASSGKVFGPTLDLGNTPGLTAANVRKLFLEDVERVDHNSAAYADSCLLTEFGYYNTVPHESYSTKPAHFIKAWHVWPKGNPYINAYYDDEKGESISYYNGTVIP